MENQVCFSPFPPVPRWIWLVIESSAASDEGLNCELLHTTEGDDGCTRSAIGLLGQRPGSKHEWVGDLPSFSVGGVHRVDVAVQLVSEGQPCFGGEIYLGASTQASCSFAVAAPGRGGAQAGLHVVDGNCRWRALPALAALFTASVERKTLQHLHTHGRDVWRKRW